MELRAAQNKHRGGVVLINDIYLATGSFRLPHYYSPEYGGKRLLYRPMIVGPHMSAQDSILVAPDDISGVQDQFISQLYTGLEDSLNEPLRQSAGRVFTFGRMLVVSIVVPMLDKDFAGRVGSLLAFGFLIPIEESPGLPGVLMYLDTMVGTLTRDLSLDLRTAAPVGLLQTWQSSDRNYPGIDAAVISLFNASATAAMCKPKRSFIRILDLLTTLDQRYPKRLLFPAKGDLSKVMRRALRHAFYVDGFRIRGDVAFWLLPVLEPSGAYAGISNVHLKRFGDDQKVLELYTGLKRR